MTKYTLEANRVWKGNKSTEWYINKGFDKYSRVVYTVLKSGRRAIFSEFTPETTLAHGINLIQTHSDKTIPQYLKKLLIEEAYRDGVNINQNPTINDYLTLAGSFDSVLEFTKRLELKLKQLMPNEEIRVSGPMGLFTNISVEVGKNSKIVRFLFAHNEHKEILAVYTGKDESSFDEDTLGSINGGNMVFEEVCTGLLLKDFFSPITL